MQCQVAVHFLADHRYQYYMQDHIRTVDYPFAKRSSWLACSIDDSEWIPPYDGLKWRYTLLGLTSARHSTLSTYINAHHSHLCLSTPFFYLIREPFRLRLRLGYSVFSDGTPQRYSLSSLLFFVSLEGITPGSPPTPFLSMREINTIFFANEEDFIHHEAACLDRF